jgi:gamma-glutamyltranspeptidase/glutathione hydrolase
MQSRYCAGFFAALLCVMYVPEACAKQPVTGTHGMVVAQEPIASEVGLSILKNGGNAVDAAVAVGFALAVTHPSAGNIGGGGFMLVRFADSRTAFLDFRECAPKKANRDMYLGPDGEPTKDSIFGWRSSGVPGSVSGFAEAHKKFGSKPWSDLLASAVKLARDGFTVSAPLAASLRSEHHLETDPETKRIFLRNGDYYKPGETFKQP